MSESNLNTFIKRRHPDFNDQVVHWEFLQATYNGGRKWFDKNIFRYHKEGDQEFKDRVSRAYRFNHAREVVDLVNKYLFKSEVSRNKELAPEAVKKFWDHATRKKASIDSYMRYLAKLSSIFGRIWIVVDSINKGQGESIKDVENLVYSYEVTPQNVLDMSFDKLGELIWILIREVTRDDGDPFNSTGKQTERFRLWTRDKWILIVDKNTSNINGDTDYQVEDEGEHGLGIVPVFSLDHMISESDYSSPSMIGDIAYLDKACANYLSNLDAIIQDQTFSQLAIPAQALLPGEEGHKKVIEAGTKRIFTYDSEGGVPFFMSPDPKQAELIITSIKQIINEIYHSVGVAGERTKQDNAVGIDNSSGVAKAYDFERVNSLLSAKSASLQKAEIQLINLVLIWSGETIDEEANAKLVLYPCEFEARNLHDELNISERLEMITAPVELRRYQLKKVLTKLYPFISKKDNAEIEGAIDKMTDEIVDINPKIQGDNQPDKTTPGGNSDGAKDDGSSNSD